MYDGHTSDVSLLLPFGRHLISVDTAGHLIVWDVHSEGKTGGCVYTLLLLLYIACS